MCNCKRVHAWVTAVAVLLMIAVAFTMPEIASAASKKPAKVSGIRVTSTTYDAVYLKWNKAKNAKKYEIYRSDKRGGNYTKLKTIKGVRFKNIKAVKTGTTYWYKVRAINGVRKGAFSKPVKGTPSLGTPKFTAKSSSNGPKLTAGKVAGATGYLFYRDGKVVSNQKSLSFTDQGIAKGTTHNYKVAAYRKAGNSNVASPASRTLPASKINVIVKLNNCNKVSSLKAGSSFDLTGTITSNVLMKRIEIGIVDKSTNRWVQGAKYDNSKLDTLNFDIDKAENAIRFGALYGGTFSYRIYVHVEDGSVITVLNHTFVVSKGTGAGSIINMAKQCAWPYGTSKSVYKYPSGKRTDAYTAALQAAYGNRSGWGKQTKAGASCDVFVGTVIRASGYDTKFPRGLDGVEKHCAKYKDKWRLTGFKSMNEMIPGDIIFMNYKGTGGHIVVYLGNGLVANAHYGNAYGIIEKYAYAVKSPSKCKVFNVYRPVK